MTASDRAALPGCRTAKATGSDTAAHAAANPHAFDEHFDPYADHLRFFNERFQSASIAMRSRVLPLRRPMAASG